MIRGYARHSSIYRHASFKSFFYNEINPSVTKKYFNVRVKIVTIRAYIYIYI